MQLDYADDDIRCGIRLSAYSDGCINQWRYEEDLRHLVDIEDAAQESKDQTCIATGTKNNGCLTSAVVL